MYLRCNFFQLGRAMIHSVHSRHDRKQCLCGTDVRCRFFALDMLLTSLQSHSQCAVTMTVNRNTNNPARNISFVFFLSCKEGSMRSTKSHRNTQPLCITNDNISTPMTGSFNKCKC